MLALVQRRERKEESFTFLILAFEIYGEIEVGLFLISFALGNCHIFQEKYINCCVVRRDKIALLYLRNASSALLLIFKKI